MVPDWVEERFASSPLARPLSEVLVSRRPTQVVECLLWAAALSSDACLCDQHRHVLAVRGDAFVRDSLQVVDVTELGGASRTTAVLPGRDTVHLARCGSDCEDGGSWRDGMGLADLVLDDEDASSLRRVDCLRPDRERRLTAHDDVELLVNAGAASGTFVVSGNEKVAGVASVGADTECLDSQLGPKGEPGRSIRMSRLHLVEMHHLHGAREANRKRLTGERVFV